MDEAEKYQQRLQAIAEKRRAQEEEDRVRRETEEEWLKIAQRKRKSLRDQWLMEPMASSAEASGTGTTPFLSTQTTEEISTDAPEEIQDEGDKTADKNDENEASSLSDSNTEKPTQVNAADEDEKESGETVNTEVILQNGQRERSVLEVMEIQVERDPKTGATNIKSMAPVAEPVPAAAAAALDATGEAVFDDGRGTVQPVGATDVIGQLDMQTGPDGDVRIVCDKELGAPEVETGDPEVETGDPEVETGDPEVETGDPEVVEHSTEDLQKTTDSTHNSIQQVKTPEKEDEPEEVQRNDMDVSEAKVQQKEEGDEEWEMVNCRPEEGLDPVVLSFLGFTQVQAEDQGAVLKVEQVLIGGEEVPEMSLSENLSPIMVENVKPGNEESLKSTRNEESQLNTVESSESCPEESFPEETSQDVMLETGGEGESVGLHDLDNISDIMDSEDVSTEDPTEAQQSLPHVSNDTPDVPEATEEVPEDSAGSATTNIEEQDRHPARTETETQSETQRVEEFPHVEIIKHGSNPEDEIFEDVPLDGNKETPQTLKQRAAAAAAHSFQQEPEIQALVSPDVSSNRTRGGGEMTKHKTCQCCSVM
ncbi:paralemmin-2 isoform X4 [Astyanax mexicanus]|uniref:paralemmin-2 isoform X3 n=1 Tax=Astyanax mexicanus TaxID=7994 RepID=UPI0020CB067E|nr:paralemmin-2 isoform X3 [Astyanax mexicanus]XP_049323592.1 paralemmin-2 isoform X4 [Astyanax mexicanus]